MNPGHRNRTCEPPGSRVQAARPPGRRGASSALLLCAALAACAQPPQPPAAPATLGAGATSYADLLTLAIRPHIVLAEPVSGNPSAEVEVQVLPDGQIAGWTLLHSSGQPAWDAAVTRALAKAGRLPLDEEGRVPARLVIAFRPHATQAGEAVR